MFYKIFIFKWIFLAGMGYSSVANAANAMDIDKDESDSSCDTDYETETFTPKDRTTYVVHLLGGKFKIGEMIGQGAEGKVYHLVPEQNTKSDQALIIKIYDDADLTETVQFHRRMQKLGLSKVKVYTEDTRERVFCKGLADEGVSFLVKNFAPGRHLKQSDFFTGPNRTRDLYFNAYAKLVLTLIDNKIRIRDFCEENIIANKVVNLKSPPSVSLELIDCYIENLECSEYEILEPYVFFLLGGELDSSGETQGKKLARFLTQLKRLDEDAFNRVVLGSKAGLPAELMKLYNEMEYAFKKFTEILPLHIQAKLDKGLANALFPLPSFGQKKFKLLILTTTQTNSYDFDEAPGEQVLSKYLAAQPKSPHQGLNFYFILQQNADKIVEIYKKSNF